MYFFQRLFVGFNVPYHFTKILENYAQTHSSKIFFEKYIKEQVPFCNEIENDQLSLNEGYSLDRIKMTE